jgi:hypothetical protein
VVMINLVEMIKEIGIKTIRVSGFRVKKRQLTKENITTMKLQDNGSNLVTQKLKKKMRVIGLKILKQANGSLVKKLRRKPKIVGSGTKIQYLENGFKVHQNQRLMVRVENILKMTKEKLLTNHILMKKKVMLVKIKVIGFKTNRVNGFRVNKRQLKKEIFTTIKLQENGSNLVKQKPKKRVIGLKILNQANGS